MPVQPQQLDPLPIPQPQEQQAENPAVPPAAKPQEGMGWVKPSGAGAYVASQILTGWMAGRHVAQQRKMDTAKQNVVGAKTTYDVVADSYKSLIDQGLGNSDKPEDKQKLEAAKTAASHAWDNYLNVAQKYSTPDDDGQKKSKGKKFEKGVHDAFMGQDPQFFLDSSLKVLRNTGAPVLSYGTSQDEKNKQKLQQQTIEQNEQVIKQKSNALAAEADKKELIKQAAGTGPGAENARLTLKNQYGVDYQTAAQMKAGDDAAKLADEIVQTKMKAIKTLDEPGKTSSDLTTAERAALGIQLGPLDAYQNEVGPGKKFKTQIDAYKGYLRDTASAQAIAGRSATDRQWQQMKQAESTVLAHDLQDPKTAKEYGLPGPLKAGEKVPDWLIEKSVMGRLKPSAQDKADAKVNVDKTISHGINNILSALPAADQQFANENLVDYDEDTKTYTLTDKVPDKKTHWFKSDTVGGVSEEDYQKKRTAFMDRLARYMMKTNPGASKDRIMQGLQSADPSGFFVDSTDGSTPESSEMTPPPQAGPPAPLGEEGGPKKMYTVTSPDGKTQQMELSDDEAEYVRQAHPGVKVDKPLVFPPHGH